MSLYRIQEEEDREDPLDVAIKAILDEIVPLIDSEDPEHTELYSKVNISEDVSEKLSNLAKLIGLVVSKYPTTSSHAQEQCERLLSHLSGHVGFLQALATDPELSSLFLVGENGNQSFSSVQKALILEQAARTRLFLSEIKENVDSSVLSDFLAYLKTFEDYPAKLEELEEIEDNAEQSHSVAEIKGYFKEIASILKAALLMNDILLRNKSSLDMMKIASTIPGAPLEGEQFVKWLKEKVTKESVSSTITDKSDRKIRKLQEKVALLESELSKTKKELQESNNNVSILSEKTKNHSKRGTQYTEEIDILQSQKVELLEVIDDLKARLNVANKSASVAEALKSSIEQIEKEKLDLRKQVDKLAYANEKAEKKLAEKAEAVSKLNNEALLEIRDLQSQNQLLQSQVSKLQEVNNKKDLKIQKITSKLESIEAALLDLKKAKHSDEAEISQLQSLYQRSTEQIRQLSASKDDLELQLSRNRHQHEIAVKERDELQVLLSQAKETIRNQTNENEVLLKQLRRMPVQPAQPAVLAQPEVALKEKTANSKTQYRDEVCSEMEERLRIKRQRKSKTPTKHYRCYEVVDSSESNDECCYEGDFCKNMKSLRPQLDELDHEIRRLEHNVKRSRKVLGVSSSSTLSD